MKVINLNKEKEKVNYSEWSLTELRGSECINSANTVLPESTCWPTSTRILDSIGIKRSTTAPKDIYPQRCPWPTLSPEFK